jgi:hypothetical protein
MKSIVGEGTKNGLDACFYITGEAFSLFTENIQDGIDSENLFG